VRRAPAPSLALVAAASALVFLAPAACDKVPATAGYDATRDLAADLRAARAAAKEANKRVLVEAGGNWCVWCRKLELYFNTHPDLAALRDRNFVVVKAAVEPSGSYPAALERYPRPAAFPHLFVLEADGTLVKSQDTSPLESGDSYDEARLTAFLAAHSPNSAGSPSAAP